MPQVRALVVLPVRDLVKQVYNVFLTYCKDTNVKVDHFIKSFHITIILLWCHIYIYIYIYIYIMSNLLLCHYSRVNFSSVCVLLYCGMNFSYFEGRSDQWIQDVFK